MRTKISVKRKHITKGKRENICLCPVALALADAGFRLPRVYGNVITFNPSTAGLITYNRESIDAPRTVARFVNKFDKGGRDAVSPFNFYINHV